MSEEQYNQMKKRNEPYVKIARRYETGQIGFYDALFEAHNLPKADEWVSVADRLPEVGQDVLCGDIESDIVATGWYMSPEGFFADRTMNVTHWQPLPKAPNQ